MKIIHKELFTIAPNDFKGMEQAEVIYHMLKDRGYSVTRQTNISNILIIGKRVIRNDGAKSK